MYTWIKIKISAKVLEGIFYVLSWYRNTVSFWMVSTDWLNDWLSLFSNEVAGTACWSWTIFRLEKAEGKSIKFLVFLLAVYFMIWHLTEDLYHTPYSLFHHEDHLNEGIPNPQSHLTYMMRTLLVTIWDKQNKHTPVFNSITHVLLLEVHIFDM